MRMDGTQNAVDISRVRLNADVPAEFRSNHLLNAVPFRFLLSLGADPD